MSGPLPLPPPPRAHVRYHELDWIRVLAVQAVILGHVAALFTGVAHVSWNATSSPLLRTASQLSTNWRMPLLFFVAGAACALAYRRKPTRHYVRERAEKLVVPLVAALLTYVPLTAWLTWRIALHFDATGQAPVDDPPTFQWGVGTLWFLVHLVLMTALALPVLRALRARPLPVLRAEMLIARWPRLFLIGAGLVVLAGALVPYRWTEHWPYEHLLNVKDLARYGAMFAVGISYGLLAAARDALRRHRRASLGLWAALTLVTWALIETPPAPGSALAYGAELVEAVSTWAWVAGIVGYAREYLTRLTPAVVDLSEVSYAMYLTHPTLVVVTGFLVTPQDWSIGMKFVASALVVFVGTYLLCRVIRCYGVTRWLFGLRAASTRAPESRPSGVSAAA